MSTLRQESVDGVPVLCEECGTAIEKDSIDNAEKTVESHNDSRHNGESVAVVVRDEYDVDTSNAPDKERFVKQIIELVR